MRRQFLASLVILVILVFAGCPNPDVVEVPSIGDTQTVTAGSEILAMIYVNDSASLIFPTGINDDGTAALTTKFWMAETEITNAVMAEVLQWAYDNGRFSATVGDHNGLDTYTVKHGGQQLLNLDGDSIPCRIDYNGSGNFSTVSGYENHPVTHVTWYGAVMFCNWLTEMRDGNTGSVVYTDIDTDWEADETTENITRTGFRLPSSDEWVYTARYRGADAVNTVSGYSNPYYTKGNSASGATADSTDVAACQAVAVYSGQDPEPTEAAAVKSLGVGSANALGLYDMSGNVWEWCFTESGLNRIYRGGSWHNAVSSQRVGVRYDTDMNFTSNTLGFRLCRTAD